MRRPPRVHAAGVKAGVAHSRQDIQPRLVSRVGYSDDGQEVTILVIHDDDPKRDSAMVLELTRKGIEIEHEIPDRMVSPLAIQGGPDLPGGILAGCRAAYAREAGR